MQREKANMWYVSLIYSNQQTLKSFNHKEMIISLFNYEAEYKDFFCILTAFLSSQLTFQFFKNVTKSVNTALVYFILVLIF